MASFLGFKRRLSRVCFIKKGMHRLKYGGSGQSMTVHQRWPTTSRRVLSSSGDGTKLSTSSVSCCILLLEEQYRCWRSPSFCRGARVPNPSPSPTIPLVPFSRGERDRMRLLAGSCEEGRRWFGLNTKHLVRCFDFENNEELPLACIP